MESLEVKGEFYFCTSLEITKIKEAKSAVAKAVLFRAYGTGHFAGLQQLMLIGTDTHGVRYLDPAFTPAFWLMLTFRIKEFCQK